jgi:iron complex transport system substrate-binding protein
VLVPRESPIPALSPEERVIRIPIESVVCTSTTHIPLLNYLDEGKSLVGFPSTDLVSSTTMRSRIDSGFVKDLGMDKGLNLELLASLKPDLVMGYTMSADYGQFKKIEELGIPVVINSEYLEKHPLGRAEWIKFIALFYGKEKQADSIFRQIETSYLETKNLVAAKTDRPTVLSGIMYGDAWFLPGGRNYASTILKDAGCHYLWESDSTHGFLELGFETVFERAQESDLWIGVGTYASLAQLSAGNHRYELFKAFKTKTVYNYDRRLGAKGGNEFLELGYLRPDIILKDLVKIGHPEALTDHDLYFYRKLE